MKCPKCKKGRLTRCPDVEGDVTKLPPSFFCDKCDYLGAVNGFSLEQALAEKEHFRKQAL